MKKLTFVIILTIIITLSFFIWKNFSKNSKISENIPNNIIKTVDLWPKGKYSLKSLSGVTFCSDTEVIFEKNGKEEIFLESIAYDAENPNKKACIENIQHWENNLQVSYCYGLSGDGDCTALILNYDLDEKIFKKFAWGIPTNYYSHLSYLQAHAIREYYNSQTDKTHFSENDRKIYEAIRSYLKEKFDTDIGPIEQN